MTAAVNAWLGVDTGGTFTDFVYYDGADLRIHKVLSTPDDPSRAILTGLREMSLETMAREGRLAVIHGSTVATNAALERKGVATAYVTNEGLEDVLALGRQNRRELYNLTPGVETPPVPAEYCFGVSFRTAADGRRLLEPEAAELQSLADEIRATGVSAVAINLVFSFLDPDAEDRLAAVMPPECFVSRSSRVLPESGEYERGIATWLNAWLGPRVQQYLGRLGSALGKARVSMMQSSGGTIALGQAGDHAVNLLLSGPAGGLAAARHLGETLGEQALLTFDMGGTSTDVAMVRREIELTTEGHIGPWPVAVPMVDMHTIGAGGGSLARMDSGGALQVGPESAGADPGPACYGRGGSEPTVTDANRVLGRLPDTAALGGGLTLDRDASLASFEPVARTMDVSPEQAAEGVLRVANEHMARALRTISIQRGDDPRGYRLCSFGGAGGLHVCALAEALGMRKALVPVHGGVLSALGMLVAPRERRLSRGLLLMVNPETVERSRPVFEALEQRGRQALEAEGVEAGLIEAVWSAELRYAGQSFTLNLPWKGGADLMERFARQHQHHYGHRLAGEVELVSVRVAVRVPAGEWHLPAWCADTGARDSEALVAGEPEPVPVRERGGLHAGEKLAGPMLITDAVSTTWLARGWQAQVHREGHLLLSRQSTA